MSGHHALIAPSGLELIIACQASLGLSQGLPPEPDTPETLEGNAADWVAKQYARGNEVAYGTPIPLPGDFTVDYDMIHGAKLWANTVGYGAVNDSVVVAERIHPTACWGSPDGWTWNPIEGLLKLPDYKYGFGLVELFWIEDNGHLVFNWQLLGYFAGIMDTLDLDDAHVTVEFGIVQPRAFHPDGPVRTRRVPATYLRTQVNEAFNKAGRAFRAVEPMPVGPPPEAETGPHCIHCPARGICQTYQAASSRVVEYTGKMGRIAMQPGDVGVELAILQHAAQFLKGRINALETQAEAYLRAGQRVPMFCMESSDGGYKWLEGVTVQELEDMAATCKLTVRNVITDPHSRKSPVVTPTQAVRAGISEAVVQQYAARLPGTMKLTRESTTAVRKAFGVFNNP
jgi:hypothetical protein